MDGVAKKLTKFKEKTLFPFGLRSFSEGGLNLVAQ